MPNSRFADLSTMISQKRRQRQRHKGARDRRRSRPPGRRAGSLSRSSSRSTTLKARRFGRCSTFAGRSRCKAQISAESERDRHTAAFRSAGIRDVQIEDLLGREPIKLDDENLHEFLTGKTVMVTGAGGSIGIGACAADHRLSAAAAVAGRTGRVSALSDRARTCARFARRCLSFR